jgi:hypothetical protein
MHWHPTGPTRHPTGFIEPCLPTISRLVPTGPGYPCAKEISDAQLR